MLGFLRKKHTLIFNLDWYKKFYFLIFHHVFLFIPNYWEWWSRRSGRRGRKKQYIFHFVMSALRSHQSNLYDTIISILFLFIKSSRYPVSQSPRLSVGVLMNWVQYSYMSNFHENTQKTSNNGYTNTCCRRI